MAGGPLRRRDPGASPLAQPRAGGRAVGGRFVQALEPRSDAASEGWKHRGTRICPQKLPRSQGPRSSPSRSAIARLAGLPGAFLRVFRASGREVRDSGRRGGRFRRERRPAGARRQSRQSGRPVRGETVETGRGTPLLLYRRKRPPWLANAHAVLDAAVFAAYGGDADIPGAAILELLLALNLARAGELQAGASSRPWNPAAMRRPRVGSIGALRSPPENSADISPPAPPNSAAPPLKGGRRRSSAGVLRQLRQLRRKGFPAEFRPLPASGPEDVGQQGAAGAART
jgi:hypothetical protein